ncbi:hypothetical protein MAR_024531, partial [Mya arenaria]
AIDVLAFLDKKNWTIGLAATGKRKKPPGRKRRRKKARGSNASDKMTDSDALLLDIETARKDLTFLNQSDQSKETDNAVEIEGRRRDRTRFNDRLKGLKLSEICASPVYIPQISRLLEDSIEADPKPVDDLPVEDPDLPDSSPKTDNVYELEEEDDNDEDLPDVLTPVKPDVSVELKPDGCPLDDSPYPEAECDASESASEGDGQEEAPGRKGKTREPRPKDILSKKGEERCAANKGGDTSDEMLKAAFRFKL